MSTTSLVFADRRLWAFMVGVLFVTAGVLLHLPMLWMGRAMGFRMAGLAMDPAMLSGMGLIVAGIGLAAFGLLPREHGHSDASLVVAAPEDAPLSWAHWRLMLVLVVALGIDIMNPASLGFTIPGMVAEYGVPREVVSLVPFFALLGTVVGSFAWGVIADLYGRKASILLSAVIFVGTSICGAMPSLGWNIAMCFMMGAAAGGMLPVTYALLAEMIPSKHRGWSLVLVGGLGAVGGYAAAGLLAAWLEPIFTWRILWLANLPSGLLLVALGAFIPESAKFLMARGRRAEAQRVMAVYGSVVREVAGADVAAVARGKAAPLAAGVHVGQLIALSLVATCWGLVNFGLLLWLPVELVSRGYSMEASSTLLAASAMIALPTVFVVAWIYSAWSTKYSLLVSIAVTVLGLAGVLWLAASKDAHPILPIAMLIIGSNAIIAMLLPYAAESFPLRIRARATGWVAACSKLGGVIAQALAIVAIIPTLATSALLIALPTGLSLILIWRFGRETRGRDLRDLDPEGHVFEKSGL